MRALLTGAMLLVACRSQSFVHAPADPNTSTIVVHGAFALPVEVRTAGVMAFEHGRPRVLGSVAAKPRPVRFELDGKWVRLAPGDTLPALALERIDATGAVDVAASAGRARLLYFSASWCDGCIDALPSLRRYAAAHPEIDIIYTLLDDPEDARAFVREHAPLPGTAVRADEDARARIAREILKQIALPTFVLVDADGRVITTSNETDL